MTRAAVVVVLLAPALAAAQADDETPSLTWALERARSLDAQVDYEPAAELYEVYADACLATPTAALERGAPCAHTGEALGRAFELRRALGHSARAATNAARFREHFLYAEPRRALEIAYGVVQLHVEAGRTDEALALLDALDETAAGPRQAIVTDGLRATIAAARGEAGLAAHRWRRVERRWQAERAALEAEGPIPLEWVRATVAEGRLARARPAVERYFATRAPHLRGVRSDAVWWTRVSSWATRSRRRLVLARLALEQVYELGSVRHSVIAAATIGEMYGRQAEVHGSLSIPADEALLALARDGEHRPGYVEARSHLEVCVAWAARDGVAPAWAERCAARLHALDPEAFPDAAELHGSAALPALSPALPPGIEE
ncbi:MAG: hypothetical protein KF729_05690 [Sandaracinaceae bacterium]|nr:hypothetical protein [Sandaracinaceae bacterium]